MKKILFTLFSFLPAFFCLAQNNSNLTISTTGSNNLKIKFNEKQYSLQDRSATFQGIKPGAYSLIIYQLQLKDNGNKEYAEVFNNTITLKAQRHLEISVLRFGKTVWDEGDIAADDWANDFTNPVTSPENGSGNNHAVENARFEKIKKAINDQYYDDDKLVYAKVIVKDNLFTSEQVIALCKLFAYDDSKLNIAKYAYDYCTDKGNYFTVTSVFYYNDTRNELMKFIGSK
ncbi:MAG TPA: DUF4476 domain-containing protein [Panacibacter sp.]|nr:DUF4476 domain-containing protein [Panacibacter sp.]